MASILDRYGIKEVADVTFYEINEDGTHGAPVLYLDTLKVSTIEQTASDTSAQGGKGNAKLITWDYGKEITVNIEDALFSPKSLALMFGNGAVKTSGYTVKKSINYVAKEDEETLPAKVYLTASKTYTTDIKDAEDSSAGITVTWVDAQGEAATEGNKGDRFIGTFEIDTVAQKVITVDAQTFPGTYYITGDTFARNDTTGKDQFFQFVIYKAKVSAENTITLEAEGDPSTFSMNLTVLRNDEGKMMELIQYEV